MTRVIVCGSRRWSDRHRISDWLADLVIEHSGEWITIVHGNASGVDRITHQEGLKAGVLLEPHPAQWDRHDRFGPVPCNCRDTSNYCPRAGHRRNEEMAELGADFAVAFWDGRSTGTADMIERAEKHGIRTEIIRPVQPPVL